MSYIDEQFETDNVVVASVVCIEFINMMAAIDRDRRGCPHARYLAAANEFGALASRTLVAEAADKIAAAVRQGSEPTAESARHIDDRAALAYMRDVLVELTRPDARPETSASGTESELIRLE